MNKMKKILAMLLALTMVLGMGLTSMAATNVTGDYDDTGKISVMGIEQEQDKTITVTAYKIVEAVYDKNGNFAGYDVLYKCEDGCASDCDEHIKLPNSGDVEITMTHLNNIIAATKLGDKEITIKVNGQDVTHTYDRTVSMTRNPETGAYEADVQVGAYLVVIEGAEATTYSPIVVSVNYKNNVGDENTIAPGVVDTDEFTVVDGESWVKESVLPGFKKFEYDISGIKLNEGNEDGVEGLGLGNSVNAGSLVKYILTVENIPYYAGKHPTFNIVDTLESGLSYELSEGTLEPVVENGEVIPVVQVFNKDGSMHAKLENGKDYELLVNGQTFTIQFVIDTTKNDGIDNKEYKLNEYAGKDVVVTYQARLNNTAVVNNTDDGNANTARLNYTTDSKQTDKEKYVDKTTYTYTFDITSKLKKVEKVGEEMRPLSGAQFAIYTKDENGVETRYENTMLNLVSNTDSGVAGTIEEKLLQTDSQGQLIIKGLEEGTYYLKEIKAPRGYSVNTHEYKIDVDVVYGDDGKLTSYEVEVDDTVIGDKPLEIVNTKLHALPSTGGIGTTIFTVAGCGIMIAAAYFFFASRKKES